MMGEDRILPNSELTAARCRELASIYKDRAKQAGISEAQAGLMKNISRSYNGLASQLEMLATIVARETQSPRGS